MLQIYIPGERLPAAEHFERLGFADLLDAGNSPAAIACPQGPDGAAGTIYFWEPRIGPPGYHPSQQQWTTCKPRKELPAGRVWFGRGLSPFAESAEQKGTVPLAPPIDPASLARRKQLASTEAKLADGNDWQIPTALRLPKRWSIDEAGEGVQLVQSRYQRYYDRCELAFNYCRHYRVGADVVIPGGFSLAVEALALNYRLNADLIDWLGLFDDEACLRVVLATFEWEALKEVAQKKTADPEQ